MPAEVVLLSFGMMTPVGLTAAENLASVRAGTARFKPIDLRDKRFDPFTAAEVPGEALPQLQADVAKAPLPARETKLIRLAAKPLAAAATAVPRTPQKLPLFLALPEPETRIPIDKPRFLQMLAKQSPCVDLAQSKTEFVGRAGGLSAVGAAVRAIAEGQPPFALAGGVDSFLDLYILATLDQESRIKSAQNLDGFIPGEGATFLLLASRAAAEGLGAKPLAKLSPAAQAAEPGHLYSKDPYRGEGLTQTLTQLFAANPPPAPLAATWSAMNGESHWGKEWGIAYIRNSKQFAPAHKLFHPADCYGDLGAAAGAALIALAAHGIANNYRPAPALVYASNDRAPRAAILVQQA